MLHTLRVGENDAGSRLDVFLARCLSAPLCGESVSRSRAQKIIVEGQAWLNGFRAKPSTRLRPRDLVEVECLPAREPLLEAEPLALDVIYEDRDCIVVNKPPGLVVHPAAGNPRGTLVNALLYHCSDLRGIGGVKRPGIIHRLDKNTSGVMVVAKHAQAFEHLARQFKERTVEKEYLALVWGRPDRFSGVIDRAIGRHRGDRKKMSSRNARARARDALTTWQVEQCFHTGTRQDRPLWVSLLRLRPHTGRTHQLRVHLADEQMPVVGDATYGLKGSALARVREDGSAFPELCRFARQALHAEKLKFNHPRSGNDMEFCAPLAADLKNLLVRLGACERVERMGKKAMGD